MSVDRLELRAFLRSTAIPMAPSDAQRGGVQGEVAQVDILLVDPRPMMAEAIESFLAGSSAERYNLVCKVRTFSTATAIPDEEMADLLILHVPANATIQTVIEDSRGALPPTLRDIPFVLYAETWRSEDVWAALRAGVRGYLPTSLECTTMLDALRLLACGLAIFPPMTDLPAERPTAFSNRAAESPSRMGLTVREREVLLALQSGKTNKAIASELGVSLSTVKVHIRSVFRKTGAQNRTEAAIASRAFLGSLGDTGS